MAYRGTILIHHNPQTRMLEVIAENLGDSPGEMTHNCFRTRQEAQTVTRHDDMTYGHGDPVAAGSPQNPRVTQRNFPIDGKYLDTSLSVGHWFRVGFRGRAVKEVQIPPPGGVVVLPYEEMNPQHGGSWRAEAFDRASRAGGPLAAMFAALNRGQKHLVVGTAKVVPVADPNRAGQLKGWEVWFENGAMFQPPKGQTTGFSGTVVLLNKEGKGTKNAGLGLESMGCPRGGMSARQFILFNGDYGAKEFGIRAVPGTDVRLGIRGMSSFATRLPTLADGPVEVGLHQFEPSKNPELNSAWFEGEEIEKKLGEKKGHVDFFRDGNRINDELPDTVYLGEEAFIRAEFKDPPRVLIDTLPKSEDLPQGGWRVTMESRLPEEDKLGRVGFVGALKLVQRGGKLQGDEAALPPRQFTTDQRRHQWIIPAGAKLGPAVAKEGLELAIHTGALGWAARVALPGPGGQVDTHGGREQMERVWSLRETDYHRAALYPPEIYRGEAGVKKAPVPAPELSVVFEEASEQHPEGGWRIRLVNTMEAKDEKGQLAFVGTLKLGRSGKDPGVLPPKKFTGPGQSNTWFLPRGAAIGDHVAQPGAELVVGGRGTGWYVALALPKPGQEVHPQELADRWAFRADQFDRALLEPAAVARTRQGPDPEPKAEEPQDPQGEPVPKPARVARPARPVR